MGRRSRFGRARVAALTVAVLGLATACGGGDDGDGNGNGGTGAADATPTDDPVTLWYFGGFEAEQEIVREQLQACAGEAGLEADMELKDWARQKEEILSAITTGSGPDLVHVHSSYSAEFGQTGDLVALDDLPGYDDYAGDFVGKYIEGTEFDGQHYGIPNYALLFIVGMNNQVFQDAGVDIPSSDWTWDEFQETALALSEGDKVGFTIPGGDNLDAAFRWLTFHYAAGGRVLNDDWTEPTFNDEAGVASLEMLLDLKEQGAIPEGNASYAFSEALDLFGAGQAGMAVEGPWLQGTVQTQYDMSTDELTVLPVPEPADPMGPQDPATLADLTMYAIPSVADNVGGAWEVMQCLKSEENDAEATDPGVSSGLPVREASYAEGVEWGFLGRDIYLERADTAQQWPAHPQISEIQNAIAEGLNAAWTGSATAQEALDQAAERVQGILDSSQ